MPNKNTINTARNFIKRLKKPASLFASGIAVSVMVAVPMARADTFDAQIQALQSQNAQTQSSVNQLQTQASTYQDAINQLNSQIATLTQQINANTAQQASLQQEIVAKQAEIDHERQVLGDDIKAMYVDGQITTIEQLATSKNLSDFVDKEEYRNAVQKNIQTALAQITQLQQQLQQQKVAVDRLLLDQGAQEQQLAADQSQQASLLALNESQQSAYNQQIQATQGQIASLRQQQIAANMAGSHGVFYGTACDSSHGDTYPHPWCSDGQDSDVDSWGMYNRECVSYVAFKEYEEGRYVPYGLGNAGDWPAHVPASWITKNPQPGDAAVRPTNPNLVFSNGEQDVGHIMFIEHINGDGTIAVSQYNASLNGLYSYVSSKSTSGLIFIHFPNR
jgi:surface antigen